jgi:SWI/SNF-related matrix-associated actin-dependent regulator of chromatin subfamily A member 5
MDTEESKREAAAASVVSSPAGAENMGGNQGDDDSDVELEGMDLDGYEDAGEGGDDVGDDMEMENNETSMELNEDDDKHAKEDHDEMEEARRERMELMAAEQQKVAAAAMNENASAAEKLEYLLAQSEVFAHFLAGTVAAAGKKRGQGSRGKKNRMTEAEEDAQMLKSAQSKRTVVRLDKQPSILADHCQMHNYQLEGLNWLIKLHCNGINGILADEVSQKYCSDPFVWPTSH